MDIGCAYSYVCVCVSYMENSVKSKPCNACIASTKNENQTNHCDLCFAPITLHKNMSICIYINSVYLMRTYVTFCVLFDSMGVIMISILVWYEFGEKKAKINYHQIQTMCKIR